MIGSGTVGGALARALHARGDRVAVLSPEPVPLPAMWLRCDAVTGEGLRRGVKGCEVVVYAAAAQQGPAVADVARMGAQHAASAAVHAGARRLVLVGPVGAGPAARSASLRAHHEGVLGCRRVMESTAELRLPWLFGEGDHLLEPWLERARHGAPVPSPRVLTTLRPLWVGDAVKVLLRMVDGSLEHPAAPVNLLGPEALTLPELAERVRSRFGVRRALWPARPERPEDLARLPEQLEVPDSWPALGLGERLTVAAWLERWSRQRFG